MIRPGSVWLGAIALLACIAPAGAHSGGASYVELQNDGPQWQAQIDLPLPDAVTELTLDRDADGAVQWGEVLDAQTAIAARLTQRLRLAQRDGACSARGVRAPELVRRPSGVHLRVALHYDCRHSGGVVLDAGFWLREVPDHGVYVRDSQRDLTAVLSGDATTVTLGNAENSSTVQQLTRFGVLGVEHLLTGYDHLAFLALLLIGALRRVAPGAARHALTLECARTVTAFTAAHSLTLALAASGVVRLPSHWVEAAIAASILGTAVAMLLSRNWTAGWRLAFALGLVHGLGFASLLGELLTGRELAAPLIGFNLGLELAQLAVVLAVLPLLTWMARRPTWTARLAPAATAVLAALGTVWLWERW